MVPRSRRPLSKACPTRRVPGQRAGDRAADHCDLPSLWAQRSRQIEILARATPKRDYYCQSRRGNRLFELGLGRVARAAFTAASSKSDQAMPSSWTLGGIRPWGFCRRLAKAPRSGVGRRHYPGPFGGKKQAMNRIAYLAAVGALVLASFTASPSSAQVIVFDPNNYAQNVLRAARALQQINNQITSLQNQAQMLINQTKNLVNLPFSSLRQLQSSIQRTQQLLNQAQRIAYDIGQIDRAFSTTYAPASAGTSSQALIANAQTRWQTSLAALQDAMRVQAGIVANLDTNRTQMSRRLVRHRANQPRGHCRRPKPAISLQHSRPSNLPSLTAAVAAQGRAQRPGGSPTHVRPGSGQGAAPPLPDAWCWLPIHDRSDVSLMNTYVTFQRDLRQSAAAKMFVMLASAAAVVGMRRRGRGDRPRAIGASEKLTPFVSELARCPKGHRRTTPRRLDAYRTPLGRASSAFLRLDEFTAVARPTGARSPPRRS